MTGFIILAAIVAFAIAVWFMLFTNRVHVDPGDRERLVVRDVTGNMRVLGPGEHYLWPWEAPFQMVSVNREAVEVEREDVKSSDGVVLEVGFRYDILAGRPFDGASGQLTVSNIDDTRHVADEMVISAVTRIDYVEHREQIAQRVRAALESVFASYLNVQLMLPSEHNPRIPNPTNYTGTSMEWVLTATDPESGAPLFPDPEQGVTTASAMYQRLANLLQLAINYQLRHIGLNVVAFRITNLVYKDPSLRRALEMSARAARLREAAQDQGSVTDAQVFATDTDTLGQVIIGEGLREVGKGLRDGLVGLFRRDGEEAS